MSELDKIREYGHPRIHDGFAVLHAFAKDCERDMNANVIDDLQQIVEIVKGVQRVRNLHPRLESLGQAYCPECDGGRGEPWPCPTIRALDGELL